MEYYAAIQKNKLVILTGLEGRLAGTTQGWWNTCPLRLEKENNLTHVRVR